MYILESVLTPCPWWSRGMMGCSSQRQPACRADAPHSHSSRCLWSYEAGSYASHQQPTKTPGKTDKQEATTIYLDFSVFKKGWNSMFCLNSWICVTSPSGRYIYVLGQECELGRISQLCWLYIKHKITLP